MKLLNLGVYYGNKILKKIGVIVLLTIFFSITAGIISRYLFNSPLSWTEEVSCLMMVYLCYISAAITTVAKKHIVADYFISKATDGLKKAVSIFSSFLMLVFFIVIIVSTLKLLPTLVWLSPVLSIPRKIYYLPVWTMSIFMAYVVLVDIFNVIFPGNDLISIENKKSAEEAADMERKEAQEIQKNMDKFMSDSGYRTSSESEEKKEGKHD